MSKPTGTFEEVKSILITKLIPELEEYITLKDKKIQEEAMFLFWALDYYEQHPKEIPLESKDQLEKNRDFLFSCQKIIINNKLEFSFEKYSQGFILGALEFVIREKEAQIKFYTEYMKLYNKFKRLPELGFPDEEFQKNWEKRLVSIEEIQDWMRQRAENWYPILTMLINSKKYQKSTKKILKTLRKGKNDETVFQILSGILHSNPLLSQQINNYCNERNISYSELRKQLMRTFLHFSREISDEKVKDLCQLLLQVFQKPESN